MKGIWSVSVGLVSSERRWEGIDRQIRQPNIHRIALGGRVSWGMNFSYRAGLFNFQINSKFNGDTSKKLFH
jgi:hypothetical protein